MEKNTRVPTGRRVTIGKHRFGFRVRPGSLRVDPPFGDTPDFTLSNRSTLTAVVHFPAGLVLDAATHLPVTEVILPDRETKSNDRDLLISMEHDAGAVEYEVQIQEAGIEAEGGSRPEIEIVR